MTRLPEYDRPPSSLLLEVAPASTTTLSGDDFSGTSGTTLSGRTSTLGAAQTWTVASGTWQLNGSGGVTPTAATDGIFAWTTLPAVNQFLYTVQVTTTWKGALGGASANPGLIVRYVDTNNYWYVTAAPNLNAVVLYQVLAGATKLMASAPPPTNVTDGTAITLRADILGRDITCFINNVELYCFTSSAVGQNSVKTGIRNGIVSSYGTASTFSNFKVTTYAGPKWNFPRFDAAPSTQVVTRGASGTWDAADVNNPNVFWDPATAKWWMYYSGYDGSTSPIAQGLGLASSSTLTGAWTKDSRSPTVPASSSNVENGGIVWVFGRWLRCSDNGAGVKFSTSSDLVNWTPITVYGINTTPIYDAFLRVGSNGLLELWYGYGYPNAKIYRASSVDGGVNWSTPAIVLGTPPYFQGTTYRGNAEPSVYHLPGKEGVEYIVFADGQEQDGKGYLIAAFTVDGGQTFHWRNIVGGSGTGFDSYQKFDSYPVFAEGAFHLFHGAAPLNGNILNINITIGRLSVQWSPNPSQLTTVAAPYGLAFVSDITNSSLPTITGAYTIGSVLTAGTGTWAVTPDSYTYQWNRNGTIISGATSSTYTTVSADSGQAVTVTVSAVKSGYATTSSTSAGFIPGVLSNTVLPAISGSNVVGQTLTTSNGTWTPAPDSYTYQWNRAGVAIAGATAATYVIVSADNGQSVTATVTAVKSGFASVAKTTTAVSPTTTADPSNISGIASRYRADSITGISDGGGVSSWPDSNGGGSNAAMNAINSSVLAKYKTNILNGQPTVRFAGTSTEGYGSPLKTSTGATTIAAVIVNGVAAGTSGTIKGGYDVKSLQLRVSNGKLEFLSQQTLSLGTSTGTVPTTASIIIGTYDPATGAGSFTINNTPAGSFTTTSSFVSAIAIIGRNQSAGAEQFIGDMAEVITWNRVLTSSEITSVSQYARDRYGITLTS